MDTFDGDVSGTDNTASDRGGIVGARGTAEGLVIRIDGRVDAESLKLAVEDFVSSRERFLAGNDVTLEWVGEKASEDVETEIRQFLKNDFNITVKTSTLKRPTVVKKQSVMPEDSFDPDFAEALSSKSVPVQNEVMGLFGGIEGLNDVTQRVQKHGAVDGNLWDDPNARMIFSMLRSGQRVETEHSLIVFGDVNSGAELVAGGDIVVLGTLRGVAHAGAYDETGGGRMIFALNLQPTQLRIGSVISRGSGDVREKGPEIARVDKDIIIVEAYSARNFLSRRRD
ncbi:MAG: septum site-determining protein MinC [SAR324 cluster bacterium]|uniref:Probable septum site-determining protein MinC n=1 Tax=SAR324 cluster bacterium TaxID=2024889 RepID=A0A7X9FQT9_9DELT|nr:septum site-determining protein MinC [SAR324 cluster bacterium]